MNVTLRYEILGTVHVLLTNISIALQVDHNFSKPFFQLSPVAHVGLSLPCCANIYIICTTSRLGRAIFLREIRRMASSKCNDMII